VVKSKTFNMAKQNEDMADFSSDDISDHTSANHPPSSSNAGASQNEATNRPEASSQEDVHLQKNPSGQIGTDSGTDEVKFSQRVNEGEKQETSLMMSLSSPKM